MRSRNNMFVGVIAVVVLAVLSVLVLPGTSHAATEIQKLLASDGSQGDRFGSSVSVSGDIAVIGADYNDGEGTDSGSAYVFARQPSGSWTQQAKLLPADGAAGDHFGFSVSISGDVVLIGAFATDDDGDRSGSAYVFVRQPGGRWTEQAKLLASDGAAGDLFGYSVSVSGDVALIGARGGVFRVQPIGSAYVFVRQVDGGWTQEAKLLASGGEDYDFFGVSVSLSGRFAVIGAVYDDDNGISSGSAYLFVRQVDGSWTQQEKFLASDGSAYENFGLSVSVSGDVAVVGARRDSNYGIMTGSAYLFARRAGGRWAQRAKLVATDGAAGDLFGHSVAVSGGIAVIGAYQDDGNGAAAGSAYAFVRQVDGSWVQQSKLLGSDALEYGWMAQSVAVSGGIALIGATSDDDNGPISGAAYLFDVSPATEIVDRSPQPASLLQGNTPNPFNPSTTIRYSIATDQNVSLTIYNISGQIVYSLVNGHVRAGDHSVVWNGSSERRLYLSSEFD